MSLVIDMLDSAKNTARLQNKAVEILESSFDFEECQAETEIAHPRDIQSARMSILAKGTIKVQIQSGLGETTIHTLVPGDMLNPNDLAGICNFDIGANPQTHASLQAVGEIELVEMNGIEIENMYKSQPELVYRLIQDMTRRWRDALQSMNNQCFELRNYNYRVNGRY